MAMGIQPITGTRPTTATLTLTVRAITDIDAHSTGHTGATGARPMRGPYYGWGYRRAYYAHPYGWGYRPAYWR
jgi:hypothetical protein